MENGKQIVTLTEINDYFWKDNRITLILSVIFFPFLGWFSFVAKTPLAKGIWGIFFLLSLWGIIQSIRNLSRIRKSTYFQVRTDILISKKIQSHIAQKNGTSYRLCFCTGHYEMYMHSTNSFDGYDGVWFDIYDMGSKTIYDTAFIGDAFTLVCVGKRVHLAFNNKFFDIRND